MALFSRGEYLKAAEDEAMAETIAKVLYPEDNHYEGKSLRLKQQYFFVSATVQSIVTKHLETYGTLKNFHEKERHSDQRHPPGPGDPGADADLHGRGGHELGRGVGHHHPAPWPTPTTRSCPRRWSAGPSSLVETLLPRDLADHSGDRPPLAGKGGELLPRSTSVTEKMAIVWGGEVRMANLCVAGGLSVNGVSGLHSEILKKDVFQDAYAMEPWKFTNVTNGIDHRRWLSEINPGSGRPGPGSAPVETTTCSILRR